MTPQEMQHLFEKHRDAEAARDYDAILATFVEDCVGARTTLNAAASRGDGLELVL